MNPETEMTGQLRRALDGIPVPEPDLDRISHRGSRRSFVRSVALISSVVLVTGALGGTLLALSRLGSGPRPAGKLRPVERVDVGGSPIRRPVVALGAFWSIVQLDEPPAKGDASPLALVRIDARTLEARRIDLPAEPEVVDAGFGSVWAVAGGVVLRLDASGSVTGRVEIGGYNFSLAVGEGGVWVGSGTAGSASRLIRIDPLRLEVVRRVTFETFGRLSCCLSDLAVGEGAVWTLIGGGRLAKVDPDTGAVTVTRIGGTLLAVGEGGVWVNKGILSTPAPILRVDPRTLRIVARIDGKGFSQPVAAAGYVWLGSPEFDPRTGDARILVYRIDPGTNGIDPRSVQVPFGRAKYSDVGIGGPAVDVAVGGGAVWATDERAYQLVRIDLATFGNPPATP